MDVFFDGSLRDGVMRTCVAVGGEDPVVAAVEAPALMTSGHAEWLAAFAAVIFAAKLPGAHFAIVGDCENVVRHMDRERRDAALCRVGENLEVADEIDRLVDAMARAGTKVVWHHVRRDRNPAGIRLDEVWASRAAERDADLEHAR